MNGDLEKLTEEYKRRHQLPNERKFGVFYKPLRSIQRFGRRSTGQFSVEDSLQIACSCEPPLYFLLRGCLIPHPYGITLSADEIGADCLISQNVTIGTSGETMDVGQGTKDKPRLGHLVRCYPGSMISGNVSIGNRVIVAAHSFVDKNVPDDSVVYGVNVIKPLKDHHKRYLRMLLWHCMNIYKLVPGLVYVRGELFVDRKYAEGREEMMEKLR